MPFDCSSSCSLLFYYFLGPNEVTEQVNYKQLGVNCNKYLDVGINVKDVTDKLLQFIKFTWHNGFFNLRCHFYKIFIEFICNIF